MLKPGDFGFSNSRTFMAALIRFFTGYSRKKNDPPVIHSLLITSPMLDNVTVEEANFLVQIVPFESHYAAEPEKEYYLFRIKPEFAPPEKIKTALDYTFREFAGYHYGYFQLLWFVYRWIANMIGVNVSHKKNWMSDGVICSELLWHYLNQLGGKVAELVSQFNPDTVQPQELMNVIKNNQDVFEMVEQRTFNSRARK
ncbi:MAG: hypothetical protein JXA66_02230 [Oligoflexia bacterium]|nr:hypothetical protein [Oligoflexia bacterium]